jgi:Flp pilus assembly pilin Flp
MWRRCPVHEFLQEETGQDLIEYALLLAFLAIACVAVLSNLGAGINTIWDGVISSVSDAIIALG